MQLEQLVLLDQQERLDQLDPLVLQEKTVKMEHQVWME